MSNLISREAMMKHIEKIRQDALMMDDICEASIVMTGTYLCEEAVRNQPTAQPEIIWCKDCKHWNGEVHDGFYYFEECAVSGLGAISDDYCSRAERKEG